MSLLATRSLSLILGEPLFADLSFSLHPGDRLGLVAANGRGKSSLLRLLAGEEAATSGEITRARGTRLGHLAQDIPAALLPLPVRAALATALDPEHAETEAWRIDVALDDVSFPEELRDRPLAALSGGWQRMALLARVMVTEPDVLLLDEPTNHLDLTRIGALTRFLTGLPRSMAVILASHDRAFLDEATTRTLFLRPERSQVFALPYSRARAALDEADAALSRQFDGDLRRAEQLRRQAAKLKNIGINSGSDLLVIKTKQLTERAEKIEAAARPAHREKSAGAIRLAHGEARARALLALDRLWVTAPDGRRLYQTGQLWISPGERVVVLGANGAGKSRLLAAVAASIAGAGDPAIRPATSLVLGHSDQDLSQLPLRETPFDALTRRFDLGDQAARSQLAGAGILPDRQARPIATLSGGQRARLAMLVLRLTRPNFYLLDEPTNHLDIEGQEKLEAELATPEASALLVSHDRAFVRATANRFWQIMGKALVEVDDPEDFFRRELG